MMRDGNKQQQRRQRRRHATAGATMWSLEAADMQVQSTEKVAL